MLWMMKKPGEANPNIKFDIRDYSTKVSSHEVENGSPTTWGGTEM